MAGRLRKFSAGASRQRGLETISAGRLWGSDEFALSCATSRHRNRRDGLGDAKSADEISRIALAGTGRGNLGSAGRSQKFHPFENDGVVGVPSGGAIDRRGWFARRRRRVLALLVLVRYLSEFARAQRRSARTFRTPAHVAKRSRFDIGRIRSAR